MGTRGERNWNYAYICGERRENKHARRMFSQITHPCYQMERSVPVACDAGGNYLDGLGARDDRRKHLHPFVMLERGEKFERDKQSTGELLRSLRRP